jgi:hypothetical protein
VTTELELDIKLVEDLLMLFDNPNLSISAMLGFNLHLILNNYVQPIPVSISLKLNN